MSPAVGPVPCGSWRAAPSDAVVAWRAANRQLRASNVRLASVVAREQELRAQAEQARQRQADFLTLLAHELRAPLAPIRNAAALLGQAGAATMLPYVREVIERQVDYATRLVEDLLDTSRLRTGKVRLQRQVFDIGQVMAAAVQSARPAIERRRQRLALNAPPAPLQVDGDAHRLTQVLHNLLANASKYTPDGGRIGLSWQAEGTWLAVVVSDTGIGIGAAALRQVFEPYMQEPHAIDFDASGLGLGLTVARDLVLAHGGQIAAHSDGPGCGSRFELKLPLVRPA